MKTLEVDDVIYDHILKNATRIGEDASSILRRLLRLSDAPVTKRADPVFAIKTLTRKSLQDLVQDPRFLRERDSVNKFLFVLSWLWKEHRSDFRRVLAVRGRTRLYFAESAQALEDKGNSVNPQKIPESPFWVITNNDTPKKQRMLIDVMRVLGYPSKEAEGLADFLE